MRLRVWVEKDIPGFPGPRENQIKTIATYRDLLFPDLPLVVTISSLFLYDVAIVVVVVVVVVVMEEVGEKTENWTMETVIPT